MRLEPGDTYASTILHWTRAAVRDQLFLAFRLASPKAYCGGAEPLPLVADDILVHFDDERSEATLDLLSEFAATTQVLLFAHHLSVLRGAERLARDGRAAVVVTRA